jgi:transposase
MDRPSLERLLSQGHSLAEIGRRFDRHEATVGYWVKKHGLQAVNHGKHSAKGGLARDELEAMVEAYMSISQIAAAVGRSKATVRHWLARYGLVTHSGPRRERLRAAREAGVSTAVEKCRRHGNTAHHLDHEGYYRCKRCRTEAVMRRRRKLKRILVADAGGCCRLCGYDRYFGALQFHHLDPAAKSFGLSVRGLTPSLVKLRAEARKCVLLCSNCHAEVESGISSISGVAQVCDPG